MNHEIAEWLRRNPGLFEDEGLANVLMFEQLKEAGVGGRIATVAGLLTGILRMLLVPRRPALPFDGLLLQTAQ